MEGRMGQGLNSQSETFLGLSYKSNNNKLFWNGDFLRSGLALCHTQLKLLLHLIILIPNYTGAGATYREHFIHSEKICPNPLHTTHTEDFPKNTLIVNLPKTLSLFGAVNDFPCNFATSTDESVKKVIVRAIHPSTSLWDFTDSKTCDYFIKFKRIAQEKPHAVQSKEEVICRVWKQQHENNSFHQGSFFHPMMWNSPNNKMTLSFSTYDWDYRLENNDTLLYKPSYLQIVFLVYGDNNYCSVLVQQYLIDPLEGLSSNCSLSSIENYQHCGQYECSEAKVLLQSIGFRTYEIDDIKFTQRLTTTLVATTVTITMTSENNENNANSNFNNSNANITMTSSSLDFDNRNKGDEEFMTKESFDENGVGVGNGNGNGGEVTEESGGRTTSTIQEFDIFKTTTRTTIFYNNTVTGSSSVHNYAVGSIVIVPIIVIILVILSIRCYMTRCHNNSGFSTYESRESLIVPLSGRHSVMVNTHVSENGTVEIHDYIPPGRSWSRRNSMDYIQPFDIRNLSAAASKTTISAPPSYETLGPPRYSDAVVI